MDSRYSLLGGKTLSGPDSGSARRGIWAGNLVFDGVFKLPGPSIRTITVELLLSDSYIDIVGQGIDIAVRFGEITDSTLRSRQLKAKRRVICAAPAYLQAHGAPKKPVDLKRHNCLLMRFGGNLDNVWQLSANGVKQIITVRGDRVANDGALVHQWALQGHGIALKSELDIGPDLQAGRLVELLPAYAPPPSPVQLLLPPGRTQPRRVRALVDHLAQAIDGA